MDASSARVIYLSSFEYPSTHGHPLHALSMARAFHALLGERFLFVIGGGVRDASLGVVPHASPFRTRFSLLKVFHLRALGYAFWLLFFLARNRAWRANLIIFTNDLKLAAAAGLVKPFFRFTLVPEVHGSSGKLTDALALSMADKVVYVTQGLKERFSSSYSRMEVKGMVQANAVDTEAFASASAAGVREELGIPGSARVIGYVGRFHPMTSDKGVDFLIDSLAMLPDDVCVLLVGGTTDEIRDANARASLAGKGARAFFVPLVPFDERYRYFLAADALAYVPPTEDAFLREETSPMKLFEYMAAKRPILASDFPAFREALGEDAFFITPGSREEFARAVEAVRDGASPLVERAYERAKRNSWSARAATIVQAL